MRNRLRSKMVCLLVAVALPLIPAAPAAAAQHASSAGTEVTATRIAAGDEAVTGSGDEDGYHLYASAAADGWHWRSLATILPGGYADEKWLGRQCLTGDGRWVVAVVAPWSASNSETGMNQGGLAYAVDAHTGTVHTLASGVSLAYFSPTCGTGDEVTLTSYLGTGQQPTLATVLDAATGATVASAEVPEEVTSAAWDRGRLLAARDSQLVDITSGTATVLDSFAGQVADLHPAADGGLDLVAQAASNAQAWHLDTDQTRHLLASGASRDLQVFGGRAGHNTVSGAALTSTGSSVRVVTASAGTESVSLDGGLAVPTSAVNGRMPAPALSRSAAVPARRLGETAPTLSLVAQLDPDAGPSTPPPPAASTSPSATPSAAPNTTVPACSVARNDIFKQVWQPTSDQVRWAVNQAVQGALTSPRPNNPQLYSANPQQPLTPVAPSVDFPPVAGAPQVPPLVMYGILAQESNFNQASWHAAPGRSGNPLVANYYGTDDTATTIDYSKADCGYGVAQVTDGMAFPAGTSTPSQRQLRVAVDYATNVAAGAQILQTKWQQLRGLGIIPAGASGSTVENWYTAIWAYNSGAYTDPTNRMGLGWLNNPANPIYPAVDHRTFLHDGTTQTPGDANAPANWPYQERVLGWIEVPQNDANGLLEYRGSYDWDTGKGSFLRRPGYTAFCDASNNCTPGDVGTGTDPCPAESSACWWDEPLPACTGTCTTDTPSQAPNGHTYYPTPGAAEPAATPGDVVCASSPGHNAVIVDDEQLDASRNPSRLTPNLMGCPAAAPGLTAANSSFTLTDIADHDVLNSPASTAAIDLHQVGAGLGGHLFFTHTQSSATATLGIQGTWTARLAASPQHGTMYQVSVFVPDIGAAATEATYSISATGPAAVPLLATIDQSQYPNQWVSLGNYRCGATGTAYPLHCDMSVSLDTVTPDTDNSQGADIAFDAMAFTPVAAVAARPNGPFRAI